MKKPFQVNKILIPLDFSNTSKLALEHASHLCKCFGADLHLLHIYSSSTADVLPNLKAVSAKTDDTEELKSLVSEEMDAIGRKFHDRYGVNYNIEVREGSVPKEISRAAKEAKADLIVMGTHGVSGFEEFFIGSNAYKTVTSAPMPVLSVQEHADKMGFENIVLPIDESNHTRDKVSQVVTMAKACNSTVHIVGINHAKTDDNKKVFHLKVKQVEEHLENNGISFTTAYKEEEDIADATIKFAEEVNGDLIAIMTDQENYTGFFMGPYAQRIVNHSKIPVLSVTPLGTIEGFSQRQLGGDYRPFHI